MQIAYYFERGVRERDKDKTINLILKVIRLKFCSDTLSCPRTGKVTKCVT